MEKLRSIQVLRGLAACAVVVMHARYYAGPPMGESVTRLGGAGVDLFFVISGFIMATIAKPSAREFIADRAWRILPLWFLAVTPWILWKHPGWPVLLASLTLWPIYSHFTPPALGVGWSLSFEMLFYLSIVLAMLTRPIVPLALFAVALLAGALTGWPLFDFIGNPMIFEFLFGVAIARLPRAEQFAPILLVVSLIGFAAAPMSMYPADVATDASVSAWRAVAWGVPASLLVYACLCMERQFRHWVFSPLVLLGNASYSIYLFHRVLVGPGFWWIRIVAAVIFGVAVHWFVERRIMRLKPSSWTERDRARAPSKPSGHAIARPLCGIESSGPAPERVARANN